MKKLLRHLTNTPVAVVLAFLLVGAPGAPMADWMPSSAQSACASEDCSTGLEHQKGLPCCEGYQPGWSPTAPCVPDGVIQTDLCNVAAYLGMASTVLGIAAVFTAWNPGLSGLFLGLSWVSGAMSAGGFFGADCANPV